MFPILRASTNLKMSTIAPLRRFLQDFNESVRNNTQTQICHGGAAQKYCLLVNGPAAA